MEMHFASGPLVGDDVFLVFDQKKEMLALTTKSNDPTSDIRLRFPSREEQARFRKAFDAEPMKLLQMLLDAEGLIRGRVRRHLKNIIRKTADAAGTTPLYETLLAPDTFDEDNEEAASTSQPVVPLVPESQKSASPNFEDRVSAPRAAEASREPPVEATVADDTASVDNTHGQHRRDDFPLAAEDAEEFFKWRKDETEWLPSNPNVPRDCLDVVARSWEERCRFPFVAWVLLDAGGESTQVAGTRWVGEDRPKIPLASVPKRLRKAWDCLVRNLVEDLGLDAHSSMSFGASRHMEVDGFLKVETPCGGPLISPPGIEGDQSETIESASVAVYEASYGNRAVEKFLQLFRNILALEWMYMSPERIRHLELLSVTGVNLLPDLRQTPAVFKARVYVAALKPSFRDHMMRLTQHPLFRHYFLQMRSNFMITQGAAGEDHDGRVVWPPNQWGASPINLLYEPLVRAFYAQVHSIAALKRRMQQLEERHNSEIERQKSEIERQKSEIERQRSEINELTQRVSGLEQKLDISSLREEIRQLKLSRHSH